jgi:outer membrane immunogenic protein
MRKSLLASASVLALSCSVAEAAPPAPMTWTGFYIGANARYAWGNTDPTLIVSPFPATAVPSLTPRGFIGGGQAGYNWQTGQWVFGGEIDFSGLDAKADAMVSPFFNFKGSNSATWSSRYDWLFTARLRGGLTVAPNWLLYVTGGLAVTHVRDSATLTTFAATWSESSTLTGGTIGGGLETMFAPNWSARIEYLYAKFKDTTPPQTSGLPVIPPPFSFNHDLNVVRFAINYKFGP